MSKIIYLFTVLVIGQQTYAAPYFDPSCELKLGVHTPRQGNLDLWGPRGLMADDMGLNHELRAFTIQKLQVLRDEFGGMVMGQRLPIAALIRDIPFLNLTQNIKRGDWNGMSDREKIETAMRELFRVRAIAYLDDQDGSFSRFVATLLDPETP